MLKTKPKIVIVKIVTQKSRLELPPVEDVGIIFSQKSPKSLLFTANCFYSGFADVFDVDYFIQQWKGFIDVVFSARGKEAIDTAIKADLVVLNTAVAGKWLDAVLNKDVPQVLPKVLWWIHEMRGHYFKLDYVKHLPMVAGSMIDSYVTAEYWKNRTQERLKIRMPKTYVVHLGNSKELMDVAENSVAKKVLREHVRESLGVRNDDILFAAINSVSRGKGQDLFLWSFYESLQLIQEKKLQVGRKTKQSGG